MIQLISCGSAGPGERPGCSPPAPQGEFTELRRQSFGAFYLGLNFDLTSVDYKDKKSFQGTLFRGGKKKKKKKKKAGQGKPKWGSLKLSK